MKLQFIPACRINLTQQAAEEFFSIIKHGSCAWYAPTQTYDATIVEAEILQSIIADKEFATESHYKLADWLDGNPDFTGWRSLRLIYLDYTERT